MLPLESMSVCVLYVKMLSENSSGEECVARLSYVCCELIGLLTAVSTND